MLLCHRLYWLLSIWLVMTFPGPSSALTCGFHEDEISLPGLDGASPYVKQVQFLGRKALQGNGSEFLVFGTFSKQSEKPFMHDVEHPLRQERLAEGDQWEKEISGSVAYVYTHELKFQGVRLMAEGVEPFETDETYLMVWSDMGYLSRLPPLGVPVAGVLSMRRDELVPFGVPAGACPLFHEITQDEFDRVVHCVLDGAC